RLEASQASPPNRGYRRRRPRACFAAPGTTSACRAHRPMASKVVASIDLALEGRGEIARAWSDPKGSRGEGAVLLPGGHLLVAKEKKPAAFIEFGPPNSPSLGLVGRGGLADGERWPI